MEGNCDLSAGLCRVQDGAKRKTEGIEGRMGKGDVSARGEKGKAHGPRSLAKLSQQVQLGGL